jgi:maleylacetoacetate isomerase
MITLYDYWRSSASYRVRIGLNLLNLRYHAVAVNLAAEEQRSAQNLARNPQGLVPTLEIDGLRLTQSLAILEYLNDTRGGGLLPPDAPGRGRVRALAYALAMEVAPICNLSVRNHVASLGGISAEDWQRHYYHKGLTAFEAMLHHGDTGRFCHGSRPTLADLCLVPLVYNAERLEMDVTSFTHVAKIVANLRKLPAVAAAHPDKVKP